MTTRNDIPARGTGPAVGVWYAYDQLTGLHMALSTPTVTDEHRIKLALVPPGTLDPATYLGSLDLSAAPAMGDVIEFARRPELVVTRPAHPEVAAALRAAAVEVAKSPPAGCATTG